MKRWLLFLLRSIGSLFVAAVYAFATVGIVLGVVCVIDRTNIARKTLESLAPYSSSIPWLLCIVALVLVLCVPGGATAFLGIFRRVQKIGPVEFDNVNARDSDVDGVISQPPSVHTEKVELSEFKQAELRQRFREELKGVPKDRLNCVLKELDDLVSQKRNVIAFHAGRSGAVLVKRGVKIKGCRLFFDAYLKRDDDQIALHIINQLSKSPLDVAQQAKSFFDRLPSSKANTFFVHLVFCIVSGNQSCVKDIDHIRRVLFNVSNVRLYFYTIGDSNAVAIHEVVP